jgi:hypothetical protein
MPTTKSLEKRLCRIWQKAWMILPCMSSSELERTALRATVSRRATNVRHFQSWQTRQPPITPYLWAFDPRLRRSMETGYVRSWELEFSSFRGISLRRKNIPYIMENIGEVEHVRSRPASENFCFGPPDDDCCF